MNYEFIISYNKHKLLPDPCIQCNLPRRNELKVVGDLHIQQYNYLVCAGQRQQDYKSCVSGFGITNSEELKITNSEELNNGEW